MRRCGAVSRHLYFEAQRRWFAKPAADIRPFDRFSAGRRLSDLYPYWRLGGPVRPQGRAGLHGRQGLANARDWRRSLMATKGDVKTDVERIREAIRLLNLTLDKCNELLVQAEAIQVSKGGRGQARM